VSQIRPLADIVHFKYARTYLLTYLLFVWLQDLRDGLNYGLFCPPDNGRAGKFMDEERLLTDYALPGPIGYLEVFGAVLFAVSYYILVS